MAADLPKEVKAEFEERRALPGSRPHPFRRHLPTPDANATGRPIGPAPESEQLQPRRPTILPGPPRGGPGPPLPPLPEL
jgi:hypothetical protein